MKNKKCVNCIVKKINNDNIQILFANKLYTCYKKDISDYKVDLKKMFQINKCYKFTMIKDEKNNVIFSYKEFRPKLIRNRHQPIPTISGFSNLSENMHQHLRKYKFNNK